jgi:hypothetical protein
MPVSTDALGAKMGSAHVRRIYQGSTIVEPGVCNLATNPAFETPSGGRQAIRTNLATNPSVASSAGWYMWAGTGGTATGAPASGGGAFDTNFFRALWTVAPSSGGGVIYDTGTSPTTLSPNTTYTFSMYVRSSVAITVQLPVQWYNGSTPTTSSASGNISIPANVWTRVAFTATSGANDNRAQFRCYATTAGLIAGSTFDGDAVMVEAFPVQRPYFDGSFTTTNIAPNPRAVTNVGFFSNNSAILTVTKNQPVPAPHPQGITTAAKSVLTPGHPATPAILSMYNIEGFAQSGGQRWLGAWFYVNAPGYKVAFSASQSDPNMVDIPANTWMFIASPVQAAGAYSGASIQKPAGAGNSADADAAWITGLICEDAPGICTFYDAALEDYTFGWSGAAGSTSSRATAFLAAASAMGNGSGLRSQNWDGVTNSVRLVPNGVASSTLIVGSSGTGYQVLLQEGHTYTVSATRRMLVALTGSIATGSYFGRIILVTTNSGTFYSDTQLPNAPGISTIVWTFTVPVGAGATTLRLGHGGTAGSGDIWWDNLMVVDGTPWAGAYRDGRSPGWAWDGTADATPSRGLR